jgi:type I restriction enzyme S subunit
MSKENKNKLLPKLRFPEFLNNEGWEKKNLNQVSDVVSGQSPAGESYNEEEIGIPFYQGKTDFGEIFLKKPTKWTSQPTKFANKGNILMSVRAPVGALNISTDKICIGRGLAAIQPQQNTWYLFYFLNRIKNNIIGNGGSVFDSINKEQIEKISILIPKDPQEQQKIADCLSSLDDLINAENKKLEALETHKKGLMQNLFPAEGEKVPKLRFKEFKGEWKKEDLGNLIEIKGRIGYRGYTINDIVRKGEGAISLSPSNIDDNNLLNFEKSTYVTWEKYNESPEIMLMDGYTVLVKTGSSFGKATLIKNLPEKSTINPQLVVLKPTNIDSIFLFLIVFNTSIQKQIRKKVVGGAIPTLSQESISKFEVFIPPDNEKKEQQKIADCLSALDKLITVQVEKIESLKLHKKGLMQGLFPKTSEL